MNFSAPSLMSVSSAHCGPHSPEPSLWWRAVYCLFPSPVGQPPNLSSNHSQPHHFQLISKTWGYVSLKFVSRQEITYLYFTNKDILRLQSQLNDFTQLVSGEIQIWTCVMSSVSSCMQLLWYKVLFFPWFTRKLLLILQGPEQISPSLWILPTNLDS